MATTDETFEGWTVVRNGATPKGVPRALSAQLAGKETVTLLKPNPDDPEGDPLVVHIGGEDGIDPEIVLDRAKKYALEADARRAMERGDDDALDLRRKHLTYTIEERERGASRQRVVSLATQLLAEDGEKE